MKLTDCCTLFSIHTKMTRSIKSHFMSDKKIAFELWKYHKKCGRINSIEHAAYTCPHYEYLRTMT